MTAGMGLVGISLLLSLGLAAIRIPIAYAVLAGASFGIYLLYSVGDGGVFDATAGLDPLLTILADVPYSFAHSYELATIPLYILLGHVAQRVGITSDVFGALRVILSGTRAGLVMASLGGCAGFSAISGSSVACAAAMGRVAVPEMLSRGYSQTLAAGAVAAGGTLGSLIPPSIAFLLFAILAEQSLAQLFLAGIFPGLLTLLGFVLTVFLWSRLKPEDTPVARSAAPRTEKLRALGLLWPAALILGIIVGGLVTGLFTVIQAAAVSVLAALLIGWARRRLNATEFHAALKRTCLQSGALFAISFGAKAFTVLVAGADMSTAMIEWMTASSIDGWMVIAVIVLALLLMGMFLDPAGIILLAVPVTLPVVMGLGYDVVWYAVIFVKVLEIGLITPPLGLNIFALKASLDAADSVSLENVYKGALAFLAIDLVVLVLLLALPDISLFLPALLGQ